MENRHRVGQKQFLIKCYSNKEEVKMRKMIKEALVKVQGFLHDESGSAQKSLRLPVVGFVLLLTAGVLFLTPKEAWACKPPPGTVGCSFQTLSHCCTLSDGSRVKAVRAFCPDGTGGYTVSEYCNPCLNGGSC